MQFNRLQRRPMAELNVTPMVDVMLVLLVVFMVTAPLMQQGVAVTLPQVKAQALDVSDNQLVLSIDKNQHLFLGRIQILLVDLKERLRNNTKLQQSKEILIHADKSLVYGFVVDVLAILKDAGIENVGMVTDPSEDS